jgi:hypothetical protein
VTANNIVDLKQHQGMIPDALATLTKQEQSVVEGIALRMTMQLAAELDKIGYKPTTPQKTYDLALDLAFIHELSTAICLRTLDVKHPLQEVITECLTIPIGS